MADRFMRVNELRLRVPGLSAEEGRAFGEDVARRVAETLSQQMNPRQLGALTLKVRLPAGTPHNQVAGAVAKAILRGLK